MEITFYVEGTDYEDYVTSLNERNEVIKNHIKPGDILEKVQLQANLIYWNKRDVGKETKELKHIIFDIYSFSGKIIKMEAEEDIFESIIDCTLPIRMYLGKSMVSELKIKRGDFIYGIFRLKGYICYDECSVRESIKGKVTEIKRFEPFESPSDVPVVFITLETIPV